MAAKNLAATSADYSTWGLHSASQYSAVESPYFRLLPLTAAVMAAIGVPAGASAASNVITPDGSTRTKLHAHGDTTDITTKTTSGRDAFNSFHRFEEAKGNTVNMRLPGGTQNLINLVHDRKVLINGTLNSIKNGHIGGHVFFADPHGLMVGAQGVVNVGALTISTPTKKFMKGIIGPDGGIDPQSVVALKAGQAPQSADGTVEIKGRINARHGVRIHAQSVDASGVILVEHNAKDGKLEAGSAVNTGDSAGHVQLAKNNGGIEIVAEGDAAVSGELVADGAKASGGGITVSAGHDIATSGAALEANGLGQHAAGGTITVAAKHDIHIKNSTLRADAGKQGDGGRITVVAVRELKTEGLNASARGGAAGGDGGFVEVSSRGKLSFNGQVDTHAPDGQTGELLLDPDNLYVVNKVPAGGHETKPSDDNTAGGFDEDYKKSYVTVHALQKLGDTNITLKAFNQITLGDDSGKTTDLGLPDLGSKKTLTLEAGATNDSKTGDGNIKFNSGSSIETGGGSVVIDAGAGFDKAAATVGKATLGDIKTHGGDIKVNAGGMIELPKNTTLDSTLDDENAGDITLEAVSESKKTSGLAQADNEITVHGVIKANDVTLKADATAIADFESLKDDIETAANLPEAVKNAIGVNLPPGPFGVVVGDGTATIEVGDGAQITANGDLTLSANTDTQAKTTALDALGSTRVVAAGVFGGVIADTEVTITDGAKATVGGDLHIKAINKNNLNVSSAVKGDKGKTSLSAAVGLADITTTAGIDSGANITKASDVVILAHNANSFTVSANVDPEDNSKVGLEAALGFFHTTADASSNVNLGREKNPVKSVVVDASSSTATTDVEALTSVPWQFTASDPVQVVGSGGKDLPGFLETKLGNYFSKADKATSEATGETGKKENPDKLSLGSSMALVDSHQKATATIGDSSDIYASGNVAVLADVTSKATHTNASSETTSSRKKSKNNPKLAISLAVDVGLYDNDAEAVIGSGADITADHIGVGSTVDMPWDLSTINEFDNIPKLLSTIYTDLKFHGQPLVTGYADAESGSETDNTDVAGAVNFLSVANTNNAWVGHSATLTSLATDGGKWKTRVDVMPDGSKDPPKEITDGFNWTSAVDIAADTTLQTITDAGNFDLLGRNGTSGKDKTKSVGGGVNLVFTNNTTTAGIGADATVTASASAVDADTTNQLISVTPTAGRGSGISGNVIFAMGNVDDTTHAGINGSATINSDKVRVNAHQGLGAWSIAGAVSQGSSVGVGFAVGVNNFKTDTQAYIGDNHADAPENAAQSDAPAATGGSINTDDLKVEARTDGRSGAITVAAAAAANKDEGGGKGDGGSGKSKFDIVGKKGPVFLNLAQNFLYSPRSGTSFFTPANVLSSLPLLKKLFKKAEDEEGTSSGGGDDKSKPKFGLGVSGSASVNMAALSTEAFVQGVTVDKHNADAADTTVNALNQTDLISASGAGALAAAKNSSSKFNAGIAGAIAYSAIGDTTKAWLQDDTFDDAGDVAVQALSGGSEITLGLGLSVNTSSKGKGLSAAGSFSLSKIGNTTQARARDSTLTASKDDAGALDVTAYDHTDIGAGGGSLSVKSKGGGGFGGAVTYGEIANTTSAALLGGTVDGFDSVSVAGLSASRIADAALSVAAGGKVALEGGFVVNIIGNTTSGNIGSHNANATTVQNIGGQVNVKGSGTEPVKAYDTLLKQNGSSGSAADLIDFTGKAIGGDDSKGTAIFAAALSGGGSKNSAGLAAAYNQINDTFRAGMANATVDSSGAIAVQAVDDTRIIGLSVGAALATGQFAGMGSATANLINDNVVATIGDSDKDEEGNKVTPKSTAVTGASVLVNAQNGSVIDTLSGEVAIAPKGAAAGLAISFDEIGNQTDAAIEHATVTRTGSSQDQVNGCSGDMANVAVQGCSTGAINALSVGAAVSKGLALAGSLSINDIGLEADTPLATLRDTYTKATVESSAIKANSLTVAADDSAAIKTLSGGIAASRGDGSVGAAFSIDNIAANTSTTLKDSQLDIVNAVMARAESSGEIDGIAVGGSVSKGFAAAGSLTDNLIGNRTTAVVQGLSGIAPAADAAMQSLAVKAKDNSTINSLAGAVALALGKGAVGAAIGYNAISNTTRATLRDSALDVTDTTNVQVHSTGAIKTIAVAAAGSKGVGLAGAATTNIIDNDIGAKLSGVTLDDPGNVTTIAASDGTSIKSSADSAGVGKDAGGAAAVAVNRIGTGVTSELSGGVYHAKDVTVSAESTNPNNDNSANIQTLAAGVGGGSKVGGAASVAVNMETSTVDAHINDGAHVTAENNVAVTAHNRQGVDVLAGSLGIGVRAGLGFGLAVNDLEGTTTAYIDGADTQVNALAKDSGDKLGVASGRLEDPNDVDVTSVHDWNDYTVPDLSESSANVTGLAVDADSQQSVATLGASAALSFNPEGSVALSAMIGTNVLGGATTAYIQDAKINRGSDQSKAGAEQNVSVIGSSHTYAANFVAGIAGGASDFAGAGAVDVNAFDQATKAYVSGAKLTSKDAVTVDAEASQRAVGIAAGLAAAITGGAGTGIVNLFKANTQAYVASYNRPDPKGKHSTWIGSDIDAGSLMVHANSENDANLDGGSAAFGAAGLAGTVLLGISQNTTNAFIGNEKADTQNTHLHVPGSVKANAESTTNLQSLTVTASAGGVAVAGMAAVTEVGNDTNAYIDHVRLDRDKGDGAADSVTVDAGETVKLAPKINAAALGVGGAAGAAANIVVLHSQVGAAIKKSKINAKGGDVSVKATSDKLINAFTLSGAAGSFTGISGAAGVIVFGQGDLAYKQKDSDGKTTKKKLNSEINSGGNGTLSKTDEFGTHDMLSGEETDGIITDKKRRDINDAGHVSLLDKDGNLNQGKDGTTATITNTTLTSSSLDVHATDTTDVANVVGGISASFGLGAGGSVAFSRINDTVGAHVDGPKVTVSGPLKVRATVKDGVTHQNELNEDFGGVDTEAYQGSVGWVGLGAAVAVSRVDNAVDASAAGTLDGGSKNKDGDIQLSGNLTIKAKDSSSTKSIAAGATGGGLAAGVVVALGNKSSHVTAGLDGTVKRFKQESVTAKDTGNLGVKGAGVSAGIISGSGVISLAHDDSQVSAEMQPNASVNGGDLSLVAKSTPSVDAAAHGVNVGAAVIGVSFADSGVFGSVSAKLGDNTQTSNLASLSLLAEGRPTVTSSAGAGEGALLGAQGVISNASNQLDVSASTGRGVLLQSADGMGITATETGTVSASGTGKLLGLAVAGAVVVNAGASPTVTATLGPDARSGDKPIKGDLAVEANGFDVLSAEATSGTGGALAGNAALAQTTLNAKTIAQTQGTHGRFITDGAFKLNAAHSVDASNTYADSTNVSLAGGGAALAANELSSTVKTIYGAGTGIQAGSASITAANDITVEPHSGRWSADGAAGGGINYNSITAKTTGNLVTQALIEGGTLEVIGDPTKPQDHMLIIGTQNTIDASVSSKVATGGVIEGLTARARFDLSADKGVNSVQIDNGADLSTTGDVSIYSGTDSHIEAKSLAHTFGGAGVVNSFANATLNDYQQIKVAGSIQADNDVFIGAGYDANKGMNIQSITANSHAYNYTALAVGTHPDATATLHNYNDVNIPGEVLAGGDAKLAAMRGVDIAIGTAVGQNSYQKVVEKVANFFGGIINSISHAFGGGTVIKHIDLKYHGGQSHNDSEAGVNIAGTVMAGLAGHQTLKLRRDDDGKIKRTEDSSALLKFQADHWDYYQYLKDQKSRIKDEIESITQNNSDGNKEVLGRLNFEKNRIQTELDEIDKDAAKNVPQVTLEPIRVRSGNVVINTDKKQIHITGTVKAKALKGVTIENPTPAFLKVGDITVDTGSGGKVVINGKITADNKGSAPSVNISSTYTPHNNIAPDIFLNGSIFNPTGDVKVQNSEGSIHEHGAIHAQTVEIAALNGGYFQGFETGYHAPGNIEPITNPGTIIAGGPIFVSAEYLNVDGLLQSGHDHLSVTLPSSLDSKLDEWKKKYDEGASAWKDYIKQQDLPVDDSTGYVRVTDPASIDNPDIIPAFWDPKTDRIVLNEAESKPGQIYLYGNIFNTNENSKIVAASGLADIRVTNDTKLPLVVNRLDAGSADKGGLVQFTDTAKNYQTREKKDGKTITRSWSLVTEYDYSPSDGSISVYQFGAGAPGDDGKAGPKTELKAGSTINYKIADYGGGVWYHSDDKDLPIGNSGLSQVLSKGIFRPVGGDDLWKEISENNDDFYKADYPIKIKFIGKSRGDINVTSKPGIWLKGDINNTTGDITLEAAKGALGSLSSDLTVKGKNLSLTGYQGVGSDVVTKKRTYKIIFPTFFGLDPLTYTVVTKKQLSHSLQVSLAGSGGKLDASSQKGDIDLVGAQGDLALGQVKAPGGGVSIQSAGSIVAAQDSDSTPTIISNDLTLGSQSGGIYGAAGTDDAMRINTCPAGACDADQNRAGVLNVNASGVVNLLQVASAGTLNVGQIVAGGDVTLAAPGGSIVSALSQHIDKEAQAKLEKQWATLGLTGKAAQKEGQNSLDSIVGDFKSAYHEYWELKENIKFSGSGDALKTEDLTDKGYKAYKNAAASSYGIKPEKVTNTQILGYVKDKLGDTLVRHYRSAQEQLGQLTDSKVYGLKKTKINPYLDENNATEFAQTVKESLEETVTKGVQWTKDQLLHTVDQDRVLNSAPPLSTQKPNIVTSGRITLNAGSRSGAGSDAVLGDADNPIHITLPRSDDDKLELTPAQAAALAAAAPGDTSVNGRVITINQYHPVYEQGGAAVNVSAQRGAYLRALGGNNRGNLNIGDIESPGGEIRLEAARSLIRVSDDSIVKGGSAGTVLQATNGSVGSARAPLQLALAGPLESVKAGGDGDIYLEQTQDGLKLGNLTSPDTASIAVDKGDLNSIFDDASVAHLQAKHLIFDVAGSAGTEAAPLAVHLSSGGVSGQIGETLYLVSPTSDLLVDDLTVGGQGKLEAALGSLMLDSLTSHATGEPAITLKAGGNITGIHSAQADVTASGTGAGVTMTAGSGIGALLSEPSGTPLVLDTPNYKASTLQGDINIIDLEGLDSSSFTAEKGSVDTLIHGDFDFSSIYADKNVNSHSDGDTGGETATAETGWAELSARGDMQLNTVTAAKTFNLHAGGDAHLVDGKVTGPSELQAAHNLTVDNLTAQGKLNTHSGNDTTLGTVKLAKGDYTGTAGGNLDATMLAIGKNATLDAGKTMNLGTVTTKDGGQKLTANRDINFERLNSSAYISGISKTRSLLGGSASAVGDIKFNAAETIGFDGLNAGNNASLTAKKLDLIGRKLDARRGDIHVRAGRDIDIDNLTSGHLAYLTAGRDTHFTNANIAQDFALSLGRDLHFGDLKAGHGITVDSSGGSITGQHLTAPHGGLVARKGITLGSAHIERRLNLYATDIDANITQTAKPPADPFEMEVTGYKNGVARKVHLRVDAPVGLVFGQLWSRRARVGTTADQVDVAGGRIIDRMMLKTPSADRLLDNTTPKLSDVDAQLRQPDYDFYLRADGRRTDTNAYIVHYARGYQSEQVSNYNQPHRPSQTVYGGGSLTRYTLRQLERDRQSERCQGDQISNTFRGWPTHMLNMRQPPALGRQGTAPAVNAGGQGDDEGIQVER